MEFTNNKICDDISKKIEINLKIIEEHFQDKYILEKPEAISNFDTFPHNTETDVNCIDEKLVDLNKKEIKCQI